MNNGTKVIIDLFLDTISLDNLFFNKNTNIYIKPHPVDNKKISKYIECRKNRKLQIVHDSIQNYLTKTNLFIGSNSISCLEAIFLDIPFSNIKNDSKLNFSPFLIEINFNMVFYANNSKLLLKKIKDIFNFKYIRKFNHRIFYV